MKFQLLPFFLLSCTRGILAQPANDNCADAITVTTGEIVSFSTLEATTDGPFHPNDTSPCAASDNDTLFRDIWYVFTPDFSGLADWTLCGTVDYDSKIAVYAPGTTCPAQDGDFLTCNDDGSGCSSTESRLVFGVTAGETYLLRLGGWGETAPGQGGSGTFVIEEFVTAVANDFCAQAMTVSLGMDQMFTNIGATTDGPTHDNSTGCFGFGDNSVQADVWYSFTAPSSTTVEWSTCDQINFDSRLAVYDAGVGCTPGSADLYVCNDDGAGCSGYTSRVIFDVVQGETYLLRLGGWNGESGTGTFDLFETVPPVPPANDLCVDADSAWISTAQEFDARENYMEGTTVNATFEISNFQFPPCLGNTNGGEFATVWYWFNTYGNTELDVHLFKGINGGSASFIVDMFESCGVQVDTNVIKGSCFSMGASDIFGNTTITNLPDVPTIYLLRVTTRLTSELPGDFFMFIVGEITTGTYENYPGQYKLFPNPASQTLHVNLALEKSTETEIQIINSLGQVVLEEDKGRMHHGFHQFDIDLESLNKGIYFLVLRSGQGMSVTKFVKE